MCLLGKMSVACERFGGIAIMGGVIRVVGGMGMEKTGRVVVAEKEGMVETAIGVKIGGVGGFGEVDLRD